MKTDLRETDSERMTGDRTDNMIMRISAFRVSCFEASNYLTRM
jgi:hypothetical protein